jgi:EAL domain-containing protein (putative c-di-GMP-specific phosphodiesterase class I)
LSRIEDSDAITRIADRIREQTAHPFNIDGLELSATVSIGVAIYPDHGTTFEELHRQADLAMYSAKKAGRDTCRNFANSMEHEAQEYLLILNGLRRALDNQEFVLHFQPQIALGTGQVVGAEALIRWNHPALGLISPGRFIPIAEDSGLIVEMGNWVIRECCRQAARWRASGIPELIVAANLSALQFRRGCLDQVVSDALCDANLDPGFLELELTESVLIEDGANVASILQQLKQIGVSLALDDFGTGYSSFAYLRNFRLDKLKIDQTFVRNISTNHGDEAIVHSIVQLARNFGLQTIAEGVETEEASHIVHRAGCDMAQGYLFAAPMNTEAFLDFLLRGQACPQQVSGRPSERRLFVL